MKKKLIIMLLAMFCITSFNQSNAQDALLGEVKMFAGNFAPRGWMKCEGQLLPITQYSALFSILGTQYGGDGRTTFALPDLRGRVAMGTGNGPGLTPTYIGQMKGQEQNVINITTNNLPAHDHVVDEIKKKPVDVMPAGAPDDGSVIVLGDEEGYPIKKTTSSVGENQPVIIGNMQPSLSINYIICVNGMFPSRN